MQLQLKTFYHTSKGPQLIDLFGYSTKGIPGVEVMGLGKYGKSIKEKIVFLTKQMKFKIALKRFVLCFDLLDVSEIPSSEIESFELPLLILFWNLTESLNIYGMENCCSKGSVSISGEVNSFALNEDLSSFFIKKKLVPICINPCNLNLPYLEINDLFPNISVVIEEKMIG